MTMPLKQWCAEEAMRLGLKPHNVWTRVSRGKYPHLPLVRVNKRVVFVDMDKMFDWTGLGPINDWLTPAASAR